ncbi:unnamed protein product, partial [Cylicostephanus goldi]
KKKDCDYFRGLNLFRPVHTNRYETTIGSNVRIDLIVTQLGRCLQEMSGPTPKNLPQKTFMVPVQIQLSLYYDYMSEIRVGVHPFYMMLEKDGKAHGVFILNSNAQCTYLQKVCYKSVTNMLLLCTTKFGKFLGNHHSPWAYTYLPHDRRSNPRGSNAAIPSFNRQTNSTSLLGLWLPGKRRAFFIIDRRLHVAWQISRWGYENFAELKEVVKRNTEAGVPFDTVVGDIDYMDRYKDFTIGKTYPNGTFQRARFVEWERRDQVMDSVNSLYPLVEGTKIMLGVVWPDNHTAFPDFLDPSGNTEKWWIDELIRFRQKVSDMCKKTFTIESDS